ncbi:hypothetical protein C8T65DRAFT_296004 [Cerioporus squamosus]|nr:hypothetical protein C8T65DRAFT_296004 [Cerioporus squamosus]
MSSNSRRPPAPGPPPPVSSTTSRNILAQGVPSPVIAHGSQQSDTHQPFPSFSASGGNVRMPPPLPGHGPSLVGVPPVPPSVSLHPHVPPQAPAIASASAQSSSSGSKVPRIKTNPKHAEILSEYYMKQNKNPSYEERLQLSVATGKPVEDIATWFRTKRHHEGYKVDEADMAATSAPPPAKKPRKKPVKFTEGQVRKLEATFARNSRPDAAERYQLACEFRVDSEAIYTWYDMGFSP